jgi:hypothetical protein
VTRSQRRDAALAVLKMHDRSGKILPGDASKFEMLIRRCRTPEDHAQVMAALTHYLDDMSTSSDRYARLMRDDILKDDDDSDLGP